MTKKVKKILSMLGASFGIALITIGAGLGITSCSSTNEITTKTPNNANNQTTNSSTNSNHNSTSSTNSDKNHPSSTTTNNKNSSKSASSSNSSSTTNNSSSNPNTSNNPKSSSTTNSANSSKNDSSPINKNNSSSSASSSSSSTSSSKTTNDGNKTNQNNNDDNKQPINPYPNGLVSLSCSLNPNQVGSEISTNEYACGSSIILSANYTYPTVVNLNKSGQIIYTWYENGQVLNDTTSSTYQINNLVANATYTVSANYSYFASKTNTGSYTCTSNAIKVSVNYENVSLALSHNDGSTKPITTSNPTTLDATLEYTLGGIKTAFTNAQLASIGKSTINFQRYDFSNWWTLNNTSNDGAKLTNFDFTTTPDGIYPFQATFTVNGETITSNIIKVNTNYNGQILSFANLPANVLAQYNLPLLMQDYITQSMSEPNGLFMQLVNAQAQVYRIIPITNNTSGLSESQYNQLSISPSDFTNLSVKWFNANNHDDGLVVSATVNAKNGIELFSQQNIDYGSYNVSLGSGNYSISKGNIISWLLPYGNSELNWWSQNPNNVMNQNINWNLNSNIYMQNGGELFNSNFDTNGVNSSNWQFYSPNWMYPTVSFKTVTKGVYWGFTITTPSGSNALQDILKYNYYQVNIGNGNTQTIYGGTGATYIAYDAFPMIESSATAETGYLTLLSSCNQMLSDLYNASIKGISTLN